MGRRPRGRRIGHNGEENLVAIGDFNANPSGQPKHFSSIIQTNELYRILWYESASTDEDSIRTTVPTKDSSSNPDYFKLPLYDHALISSETSYALPADPMTLANQDFGVWKFDDDPWWKANGWTRPDLIGVGVGPPTDLVPHQLHCNGPRLTFATRTPQIRRTS